MSIRACLAAMKNSGLVIKSIDDKIAIFLLNAFSANLNKKITANTPRNTDTILACIMPSPKMLNDAESISKWSGGPT